MKKKICFLLALIFMFACLPQFSVLADGVTPRNNNTLSTNTIFTILNGEAIVAVNFEGYPSLATGATITVKIEKRNLLIFWKDIVEETITVNDYYYINELHYPLEKKGTYRCTVEYVVYGLGGEPDVIPFERTETYD